MANNLFQKHKFLTIVIVNVIFISTLLILAEVGLRIAGFGAGLGIPPNFRNVHHVDTLIVKNSFYTDSTGVFKANPEWSWESPIQINADGFRSRSFSDTANAPRNKRILLLGDSFAWGASAIPITKSFGDLLDKEGGYTVYNTGIPGTSPIQYGKMAEMYIPKINPGIVIMAFYMANDVITTEDYEMSLQPNERLFHITNAGMIRAHVKGEYIGDPVEAYQKNAEEYNASLELAANKAKTEDCKSTKRKIRDLLYKTVIGTRLYLTLSLSPKPKSTNKDNSVANKIIRDVANMTEASRAKFYLFAIPFQAEAVDQDMFGAIKPYVIEGLTLDDYAELPDDHFNTEGHRKFYQYIKKTLEAKPWL